MFSSIRSPRVAVTVLALSLLWTAGCSHYRRPDQPASQLSFGVDMAKHGLWSEALFRFHEAESLDPNNPRIQNDLAVAYEAAGDYDRALESYKKGLKLDPNNRELRANYARFVEFYQGFKATDKEKGKPSLLPPPKEGHAPPQMAPPSGPPVGMPEPAAPGAPPPPPLV
jgi:tetratricopeptide (TPR) repeat protein